MCIRASTKTPSYKSLHNRGFYTGAKVFLGITCLFSPTVSLAEGGHQRDEHPSTFHAFRLETDIENSRDGTRTSWDLRGWIGGDYNKLWLKSAGENVKDNTKRAEFWAMYSRNIATFWDAQIGIRQDTQPRSTSYLVAGFEGLAPYFCETEAHVFVSEEGNFTARLRQEHDFLVTQKLIIQPYVEVNFSAQNIPKQDVSSGITHGEFGLQTRYEIARKFAPYVDVRYERKFGDTASIAKKEGEDRDNFIASIGLRVMF